MDEFKFKQTDTNVTKYEYVKFIKSTPKNPQDFHEMENILRHRQTSIVKEMFGNCRVGLTPEETFLFSGTSPKTLQIRNAVWYVDGYRVNINTTVPIETYSTGYIVAKIKFSEILYTSDPSIAIKDPNTNKLIETSSRVKLDCVLSYAETIEDDSAYEATVGLLKITSALSLNPVIEELYPYINIKFAEAIDIVNKSVHTEDDNKTVLIKKLTTSIDEDGNPRVIIEDTDNSKSVSLFRNQSIDSAAGAFELINVQGKWYPTLWMKSDVDEYPLVYITPDNIKLDNGNGSILDITYDQIAVGNSLSNISIGSFGISYKYLNKTGFETYPYFSGGSYKFTAIGIDSVNTTASSASGDTAYNNWKSISCGNVNTKLVYQFTIPSLYKPTDGYIYVNHKIKSDNKKFKRIITARVYTSVGEIHNTILVKRYKLNGNSDSTIEPLKIFINDITVNTVINIEYTAELDAIETYETDINTYIGTLILNEASLAYPVFWYVFQENDILFSTYMDILRIGDHALYIDKDSRLKLKKLNGNNISQELVEFKNTDPTIVGDYTEPGGKQINISNLDVETFEATWGGAKPYYDIGTTTVKLPSLSKDPLNKTEVPVMPTLEYMSHIWATINNTSGNLQPFLPQNTYYVSTTWLKYGNEINTNPSVHPFYRTIDSAINAIKATATKTGTIILNSGTHYIEGQAIDGVCDISGCTITIVSVDPKNSIIVGGFSDTTASANLYINTSMKTGASTANVGFFIKPFISFTQANSKVVCGKDCQMIHSDNFAIDKLINITGTSSFEFYGSITYSKTAWELTASVITNTSYLIYIKDNVAKNKLTKVIIDGSISSNNRYHAIYIETLANNAEIKIGGNISILNRHVIATSGDTYTTANNTELSKHNSAIKIITAGEYSNIDFTSNITTQTYSHLIHINQNSSSNTHSKFSLNNNISNYCIDDAGLSSTGDSLYGPRSVGRHFIFIENSNGIVKSNIYNELHYGVMYVYGSSDVKFNGTLISKNDKFYDQPNTTQCGVVLISNNAKLFINNSTVDNNPFGDASDGTWNTARTVIVHNGKLFVNNSTVKGIIPISITHGNTDTNGYSAVLNNSKVILRVIHNNYFSIAKVDDGSDATHFHAIHSTANRMASSQLTNANALVYNTSDINYYLTNGAINE